MKITRIKTNITRGRKPLVMVYPEDLDKLEALAIDDWISVKDEMPTPNTEVLVYDSEFYRTIVGWVFRDRSGWDSYADNYNITHWRPLPKPPKGE